MMRRVQNKTTSKIKNCFVRNKTKKVFVCEKHWIKSIKHLICRKINPKKNEHSLRFL